MASTEPGRSSVSSRAATAAMPEANSTASASSSEPSALS